MNNKTKIILIGVGILIITVVGIVIHNSKEKERIAEEMRIQVNMETIKLQISETEILVKANSKLKELQAKGEKTHIKEFVSCEIKEKEELGNTIVRVRGELQYTYDFDDLITSKGTQYFYIDYSLQDNEVKTNDIKFIKYLQEI